MGSKCEKTQLEEKTLLKSWHPYTYRGCWFVVQADTGKTCAASGDLDLSQLHDVVKNAAADAAGSVALFMVAEVCRLNATVSWVMLQGHSIQFSS